MSAALLGFFLFLIVAIAADFRVLNALICLFKSLTQRPGSKLLTSNAKGKPND